MFGIGFAELLIILAAALIFIGPDKLPGIAKSVARAVNDFRRAGDDIKTAFTDSVAPVEGKSYAERGKPQNHANTDPGQNG